MQRIRRILAAVKDPGATVLPAVAKATQLASAFGAGLELFHAMDAAEYVDMLGANLSVLQQLESGERSDYLQRLERIAARARLHTATVTVAAEWDYPAYEAIVRRAMATGADLLVAECHPGPHVAQRLLRLADWELLRVCPIPVLLVKRTRPYHHPMILSAIDPSHAHGKSATLDGDIVGLGAQFSCALRGRLRAVHACERPARVAHALAATAAAETAESDSAGAPIPLETRVARAALADCQFVGGDAGEAIRQVARRLHADIVVAGAVSRSGLGRALIGNTAERLLQSLSCDLLIVKPPEFVSRVPPFQRGARRVTAQPLG